MNLWQRKLLAYLHDPPSKPFNIAEHWAMAQTLIRNAGFEPADVAWFFDKVCDHTAAAADRVICPKSTALKAGWDAMSSFKHPLGGGELKFDQPINPTEAETQVGEKQPHGFDWNKVSPDAVRQDWARFFLHWRSWRQFCSEGHPSLAHMPADTRVPDHTIWTHCSLVSALQACVEIANEGPTAEVREFKPAFLLMQIGPVQEFIEQARSTRDLWSGSYLLSWLIAHGIKAVTDKVGPDCVLFPALRGQPLFDFLHKPELYDPLNLWNDLHHSEEQILTPNLPNRFLAIVPAESCEVEGKHVPSATELAKLAEKAMHRELTENIASACLKWFEDNKHAIEREAVTRWQQQLRQFLNVTWQTWPWAGDVKTAIYNFQSLPLGRATAEGQAISPAKALELAHQAAIHGIPKDDLDPRNYKHKSCKEGLGWKSEIIPDSDGHPIIENAGFACAAHDAGTEFQLAARRNTRNMDRWGLLTGVTREEQEAFDRARDGAVKDMLSGKEEVIGGEEWQKELPNRIKGHFFREGERLGAINLIKRIWHVAYLQEKHKLTRTPRFDSLPAVAAATYSLKTVESLRQNADRWAAFIAFQKAATDAREWFDADISRDSDETEWREHTDASVFHISQWDRAIKDCKPDDGGRLSMAARDALKKLGGAPNRYVAVLAMDGDSMGQWVSGAKSPCWRTQLAKEAVDYFGANHSEAQSPDALKRLLDVPRHVSPSYHLQLSEALANFALYLAGPIVEFFDGQIIYAGGDDVLAMLPAEKALECAQALRLAFRGDPSLSTVFDGALEAKSEQWGFVGLNAEAEIFKRTKRFVPRGYPLIAPGQRADVSAGIAIGHMHSPLQNLVAAARAAEKRAKNEYGKSAFAISLFKRSGETIQWGAKWDSKAVELAVLFAAYSDGENGAERVLSGRFPYALAELLRAYDTPRRKDGELVPFSIEEQPNGFDPFKVIPADFRHVASQQRQGRWKTKEGQREREEFCKLADRYLGAPVHPAERPEQTCRGRRLDDFLGPFLTTTFINRGGGE